MVHPMDIPRLAKPAREWSGADLRAYRIRIENTPPDVFFGLSGPNPPLDHLDPAVLSTPSAGGVNLSPSAARFLGHLDLACQRADSLVNFDSFITEFVRETLVFLGFSEGGNIIPATRYMIPLTICNTTNTESAASVCLVHVRPTPLVLLIVIVAGTTECHSHFIAEAIAAFQFNNRQRMDAGLAPLASMVIPCIIMVATRPTFYLVPVTLELATAVVTGKFPDSETVVYGCATVPAGRGSKEVADIEYRYLALERFVAFKALARVHWEAILDGFEVSVLEGYRELFQLLHSEF